MILTRLPGRALYGTLASVSLLAGCAGGGGGGEGGGGGGVPLAAPGGGSTAVAIVTTAPPVFASATTGGAAPSVFGALLYPLYGIVTYGSTFVPTARVGTRSEAADGSITLTYVDSVGPKLVTFRPGDITVRDPEGFAAQRGNLTYAETWVDSANGGALVEHMRVGLLTFPDLGGSIPAFFAFGHQTPTANVPSAGSATYIGQTAGVRWTTAGSVTTGDFFGGDVRLAADFGGLTFFSATIDNLVIDPDGANTSLPYTFSAGGRFRNYDSISTTVATAGFQGDISTTSPGLAGSGSLMGQLFGPNANEVGGTWFFTTNVRDLELVGVFGARTDLPLQPDGALAPARFSAAAGVLPTDTAIDWFLARPFPMVPTNLPQGMLRRLNSDGSLRVAVSDTTQLRRYELATSDFSIRTDAARRALVTGFEYAEFGLSRNDSPFLETGNTLTWSRYGWYGVGPSGGGFESSTLGISSATPFYFGALAPSSAVAADFRAEYAGITRVMAFDGVTDGFTGRINVTARSELEGRITLTADLGRGTVTGKLAGFSSRASGSPITMADMAMTIAGDGSIAVVDGALRMSGSLFSDAVPLHGRLDGAVHGPAGEEVAGYWFGDYTLSGTSTVRYVRGGFGAALATAAAPDVLTWNFAAGSGSYALAQSARRFDLTAGGVVTGASNLNAITGTIAPGSDGGFVLALSDGGATRMLSFLASSQQTDPMAALVGAGGGVYRMAALRDVADEVDLVAGRSHDLSYARFGQWAESSNAGQRLEFGVFHAGSETPLAQVPTAGTATYRGATSGMAIDGGVALRIFSASMTLTADFAGSTLSGTARNFSAIQLTGSQTGQPSVPPFNQLDLSGTIAGSGFTGAAASAATTAGPGTGTFEGRFYGPQALEAAGTWNVENASGSMKAWGSFGATR
jgi:hypothetical protein